MGKEREKVLVVGSGIAGLTAAGDLAGLGRPALVVEKEKQPGGWGIQYACKAIENRCQKCGACLVREALDLARSSSLVEIQTETTIENITKRDGGFLVTLKRGSEEAEGAFSAVLLCHGFQPFDPKLKPNLGYRRIPNVISGRALEQILKNRGAVVRPSDRQRPTSVAFVQCVGSRDVRLGHPYCSQVCCGYALRMARQIKAKDPEVDITFFYMDIQTFGRDFVFLWPELKATMRWVREIPGDFYRVEGDRVGVAVEVGEELQEMVFDLMVLSVGMAPAEDQALFHGWLALPFGPEGFLLSDGEEGIFVIGSASGPMSIVDTVAHAHASVREVVHYLEGLE